MFFKPLDQAFDQAHYINIGRQVGITGYIDFIQVQDMTHSCMKGYDYHDRLFIAFKINITNKNDSSDQTTVVGTFFQRYTNDYDTLCYGTCYRSGLLYYNSHVCKNDYNELEARLNKLLNNEIIYSYNSINENDYINGTGDYEITLSTN